MATSTTHQNTHIPSTTIPSLSLRFIGPNDGISFTALINAPGNLPQGTTLDEQWGHGAVGRMSDHAEANPTITDTNGKVIRGPGKANLFVVEGDEPIGIAGFGCIKTLERDGQELRAGDAGVVLKEDKRGKGYAAEAMRLSLDFGSNPVSEGGLQLDLVTITTLEDNVAMLRVIERLGVMEMGSLRPAEFEQGKREWYVEIPSEEWRRRRGFKDR